MRSDPKRPGSDIFIHGKDVTIGCLPLGDGRIEELYIAAHDAKTAGQAKIPVHIFPARMRGEAWEKFRVEEASSDPELASFWAELQPGYEAFDKTKLLPVVESRRGWGLLGAAEITPGSTPEPTALLRDGG
jgi:murein L,D-transpeptidase YafK